MRFCWLYVQAARLQRYVVDSPHHFGEVEQRRQRGHISVAQAQIASFQNWVTDRGRKIGSHAVLEYVTIRHGLVSSADSDCIIYFS